MYSNNNPAEVEKFPHHIDTLYINFRKPNITSLAGFAKTITDTQTKMGMSNPDITHVFASYNNQIIDRTGLYTILKKQELETYLKKNYCKGDTILSISIPIPQAVIQFQELYQLLTTKHIVKSYTEDELGILQSEEIEYYPNNTIYGRGAETVVTIGETLNLGWFKKLQPIDEKAECQQLVAALKQTPDYYANKLKNPTYCSILAGSLLPPLQGLRVIRYPALLYTALRQVAVENKWHITSYFVK